MEGLRVVTLSKEAQDKINLWFRVGKRDLTQAELDARVNGIILAAIREIESAFDMSARKVIETL